MTPKSKMPEEQMDYNTSTVGHEEEASLGRTSTDGGLTEQLQQMEISLSIESPLPADVVRVTTCDGKEYGLTHNVTSKSKVMSHMMCFTVAKLDDSPMVLQHVSSPILEKIIEFGEHDSDLHNVDDDCTCKLSDWHNDTFFWVNQDTLFKLIKAADFLDIPCLFKLASYTIARLIENKTVEDIRKIFGIKNDFSAYQYRMAEAEANNILQRQQKKSYKRLV